MPGSETGPRASGMPADVPAKPGQVKLEPGQFPPAPPEPALTDDERAARTARGVEGQRKQQEFLALRVEAQEAVQAATAALTQLLGSTVLSTYPEAVIELAENIRQMVGSLPDITLPSQPSQKNRE